MIRGARWSHGVADGMARGRELASWANETLTMEFVVAHMMAVETCGPRSYVGIWKGFIILCKGEVRKVGWMWTITDVEGSRESGAFISQLVEEGINLGDHCSQA